MRVGQYGIIFFNGGYRTGKIEEISEYRAVLKFYDERRNKTYKISHLKDSVALISRRDLEENSVCVYRNTSSYGGVRGCIVEKILPEEKCIVLSLKVVNDSYVIYRDTVHVEELLLANLESAEVVAERFTLDARYTEDRENSILHRDCSQCGYIVRAVMPDTNQFLSGSGILEEECICNSCKGYPENRFICEKCDILKDFWQNCRVSHSYRTSVVCSAYDNICTPCARSLTVCNKCGEIDRDNSILLNDRMLCGICSEVVIQRIYELPDRTIHSDYHRVSDKFSKNKSKRHAGIEIECIHDWGHLNIPRGWRIVSDTSISDEEFGAEYVMTEPYNGDRLLSKIEDITDLIVNTGGYVDESCGLHIHVNGLDMKLEEMKNSLAIGKSMETWIYDMLPEDRKTSRYSQPLPDFNVEELMNISTYREFVEFWYHKISDAEITTDKYNSSRYRGFNVHSRFVNGTIEFRHHHGTLDFIPIEEWLKLCIAVVDTSFNMSKASKEILIGNPLDYSASDFFYAVGLPDFNYHYDKMKEKKSKGLQRSRPKPTAGLDPDPFLDDENSYRDVWAQMEDVGMIQERDSETITL